MQHLVMVRYMHVNRVIELLRTLMWSNARQGYKPGQTHLLIEIKAMV